MDAIEFITEKASLTIHGTFVNFVVFNLQFFFHFKQNNETITFPKKKKKKKKKTRQTIQLFFLTNMCMQHSLQRTKKPHEFLLFTFKIYCNNRPLSSFNQQKFPKRKGKKSWFPFLPSSLFGFKITNFAWNKKG